MKHSPGIRDSDYPDYVCRLGEAINSLKQAPLVWYDDEPSSKPLDLSCLVLTLLSLFFISRTTQFTFLSMLMI